MDKRVALWQDVLVAAIAMGFYFFVFSDAGTKPPLPDDWTGGIYGEGLRNHLWEYTTFSLVKPPLFSLLHALVFRVSDLTDIPARLAFTYFGYTLSILVAPVLFRASQFFGADKWSSGFFGILASVSLIPITQDPAQYDFPVFLILSLYLLAVGYYISRRSLRAIILVSLVASLLVAQSTTQALFAPASLLALSLFLHAKDGLKVKLVRTGLLVSAPVLVVMLILIKNYMAVGFLANSSESGLNLMMFSSFINKFDNEKGEDRWRKAAVEVGAPDWYL